MSLPEQDFIILGGEASPGKAIVGAAGSPRQWEKRAGYGFSGAWLFYTGDGLATFDVGIQLWKPEHFDQWGDFARKVLVKPPRGTRPKALGISHPLLDLDPWNITEVVVEDVTTFEDDGFGLYSGKIKFTQWRAPLPILGKPNRAIPAIAKAQPTAVDKEEENIARLREQLKNPDALRFGSP